MILRLILVTLLFTTVLTARAQVTLGSEKRNIYGIAVRDSTLAAATQNSVELWDLPSKKLLNAVKYSGTDIFSAISFGEGSNDLITGTRSGELAFWNMASGEKTIILSPGTHGAIISIDININHKLMVVGFANKESRVYDLSTLGEVSRLNNYSMDVTTVKFTKEAGVFLAGSGDGSVISYDTNTGKHNVLLKESKWIRDIAVNHDNSKFAVAHDNGEITILKTAPDSPNVSAVTTIRTEGGWVTSVDYHPSDDLFAYSTLAGKVEVIMKNGGYRKSTRANIVQIRFFPSRNNFISVAIATKGSGLKILDARQMNFKK